MKFRWWRGILATFGVLGAVAAIGYYWFIVDSSAPSSGQYSIDIAEVRRLAGSIEGAPADEIRVEHVATYAFPATAVVAGDGWSMLDIPIQSYQLVFPGHTAIIDTALDRTMATASGATAFHQDAFDRMTRAMDRASLILVTHEHFDHIGGLYSHPNVARLLAAARLTREQIMSPYSEPATPPKFAGYQPLVFDQYHAVAPGVVLIKAPGHAPGSQMIYVRRKDGTEYLFLGDEAWNLRNVETVRERARFVTTFNIPEEDRAAVMLHLAELHRIHTAEPGLQLIPGHDPAVLAAALQSGLLVAGFR